MSSGDQSPNPLGDARFRSREASSRSYVQYFGGIATALARRELCPYVEDASGNPSIEIDRRFGPESSLHPSIIGAIEALSADDEKKLDAVQRLIEAARIINSSIIPIERKTIEMLQLDGTESILDAGCSDMAFDAHLQLNHGHLGSITGLDLNERPQVVAYNHLLYSVESEIDGLMYFLPKLNFIINDLEKGIALADKRFKVVLLKGVIYHVNNPTMLLDECCRVLSPDGKIALTTRGSNHSKKVWDYINHVRRTLVLDEGLEEPPELKAFYHHFDKDRVITEFLKRFELVAAYEECPAENRRLNEFPQVQAPSRDPRIRLKGRRGWVLLEQAVLSLMDVYIEILPDVGPEEVFERVVAIMVRDILPLYEKELEENGEWVDEVDELALIGRLR
jgi:SAM-dependent methyltransferase